MPSTFVHPVAMLPLLRTPLPAAALVWGSLAPDVPYYLPLPVSAAHTHSARGLGTDVLIGILLVAGWWTARRRTSELAPPRWPALVAALLIASATHVGWDSFTHEGRRGVELVDPLQDRWWGHHGYTWAQHASTAVGGAVLLWWLVRHRDRWAGALSPGRGSRGSRRRRRGAGR